jgi:zinc transporter ZupT
MSNLGVAFSTTLAASAGCLLGGSVIFSSYITALDTQFLAASLAISAGVMLMVAMGEVFGASKTHFEDARRAGQVASSNVAGDSMLLACLTFFAGFVLVELLDVFLRSLEGADSFQGWLAIVGSQAAAGVRRVAAVRLTTPRVTHAAEGLMERAPVAGSGKKARVGHGHGSEAPADRLARVYGSGPLASARPAAKMVVPNLRSSDAETQGAATEVVIDAAVAQPGNEEAQRDEGSGGSAGSAGSRAESDALLKEEGGREGGAQTTHVEVPRAGSGASAATGATPSCDRGDEPIIVVADVGKVGLLAGIAIILHSVPEGLTMCVAAANGSGTGLTIAIAIAIHKLFEGVIMAVPQYYASGSRRTAFTWVCIAAAANPLGGLIGVIALLTTGAPSDNTFGVIFGLISGMMTWISLGELLPSARAYDPEDAVVSKCLALGMLLMASTLVLLAYVGAP